MESKDDSKSIYTDNQLRKLGAMYDTLARLLPTEGRDYKVRVGFHGENDTMRLTMEPYTKIGKIWCDYCMDIFKNLEGSR